MDIARRTGATVVATFELVHELMGKLGGDHPVLDPNLGDTALFSDLALVAKRGDPIDLGLVPIGGHSFPPIETDARAFKADVENVTSCATPSPGASPS